ncbi:MAG: hypothetical protein AB1349_12800, partial [Elusimicrobiota bacterium]
MIKKLELKILLLLFTLYPVSLICAENNWQIETVDSAGYVGIITSIVLDSQNFPHITYYDQTNNNLKYAHWTGTKWDIQTVVSEKYAFYSSIVLDAKGYPHISYTSGSGNRLEYIFWDGEKWNFQIVDEMDGSYQYNSIALDTNDYPHICYVDLKGYRLKYARWTGTNWDIQTIDTVASFKPSLALDTNNNPHVSYYDYSFGSTRGDIKYAKWTGVVWNIQKVDSAKRISDGNTLRLDKNNYPHIAYDVSIDYDVKYAKWTGTNWEIQTVDAEGYLGGASLALDSNNYPRIAYYDWMPNYDLKYTDWDGTIWNIERVDITGVVGLYTSVALDSYNYAHISYFDYTNGDLKYARQIPINQPPNPPSLVLPANGVWTNAQLTPVWNVPSDADGDDLHFKVELSSVSDFSVKEVFESNVSTKGFSPSPPVVQGTGQCSYTIQPETFLSDSTTYYWKVAAYDGTVYGDYSETRSFVVDNKAPTYTISASPDPVTAAGGVTITIVASEPLKSIRTNVLQNGQINPTEITMSSTDNITWTGTYTAVNNYDGFATIDVTGSDNFYTSKGTGTFTISIGPAGKNLIISNISDSTDPFDPDIESTNISFNLELRPITVINSTTTIKIVSSTDEVYRTFVLYHSASGLYNVSQLWDGKDVTGNYVPDGKYFYVINSTATRKTGSNISYVTAIEKRGEITVLRQVSFDYITSQLSNPENAKITITPNPDGKTASTFGIAQGSVGSIYDIQPTSTTFYPSATLTLFYDETQLNGIDETTLDIFRYNPDTGNWTALGATLDTVNNKLAIAIDKISIYTIATINAVFVLTPVSQIDFVKPTFTVYLTINPEKTDDMTITAFSSEKLLSANTEVIPHGNSPKKQSIIVQLQEISENLWTGKFTKQTGFGDVEKIIVSGWDLAGNFGISDGSYVKNIVSSEGGIVKDPITKIEIKIDGGTLAEATLFSVRKVENKNVSKCLQTILSYEFKSDKKF